LLLAHGWLVAGCWLLVVGYWLLVVGCLARRARPLCVWANYLLYRGQIKHKKISGQNGPGEFLCKNRGMLVKIDDFSEGIGKKS